MADFKYKNTADFGDHHRHYDSILPCANKVLTRKYEQARFDAHRARVGAQRSVVDNTEPREYMHLHVKLKKMQMEEERLAIIERDNRRLLQNMSKIMRTAGNVDHRNFYEHKSLNYEKRRKELDAITRENEKLLHRIQSRRPFKVTADLEADYAQSTVYGNITTRYPDPLPEISGDVDDDAEDDYGDEDADADNTEAEATAGAADTEAEATDGAADTEAEATDGAADTEAEATDGAADAGYTGDAQSESYTETQDFQETKAEPEAAEASEPEGLNVTQQGESSSDPVKELEEA